MIDGDIQKLIDQFNVTPTVYNMRILERLLDNNCKVKFIAVSLSLKLRDGLISFLLVKNRRL